MLIGCAFTGIHFEFRKAAGNKPEGYNNIMLALSYFFLQQKVEKLPEY
jgi:hypothetical protein